MSNTDHGNTKLLSVLTTFGDLCALNVLFIIFSLPVITFGASFTAMISMTMKMVRKEEDTIFKGFWGAFKENFKQSTLAWLLIGLVLFIIYGEYVYVTYNSGTFMGNFYMVVIVVELILLAIEIPFLFPIIARYKNKFWNNVINSFLVAVSNLWSWAKLFAFWAVPFTLICYYPEIILNIWYLFLIVIFSLIAYCSSFTLRKTFDVINEKKAKIAEENANNKKTAKNYSSKRKNNKSISERLNELNENTSTEEIKDDEQK